MNGICFGCGPGKCVRMCLCLLLSLLQAAFFEFYALSNSDFWILSTQISAKYRECSVEKANVLSSIDSEDSDLVCWLPLVRNRRQVMSWLKFFVAIVRLAFTKFNWYWHFNGLPSCQSCLVSYFLGIMMLFLLHDTFISAAGRLGEFWVRRQEAGNYSPEMLIWAESFDSLSLPCLRPQWSAPFGLLVYFVLSCLGWVLGRKHFDEIYFIHDLSYSQYTWQSIECAGIVCLAAFMLRLEVMDWTNCRIFLFIRSHHNTDATMWLCERIRCSVHSWNALDLVLVQLHSHLFFALLDIFNDFFLLQNNGYQVSKW